ncbi:D-glycero-beta-D-manno-heptose 1,7-bisphosphate 7-phosphatase [Helicobacter cetorum]|uniref:D,D-heptose 1,7-bisphosphate phosphatase n=1 Tax=Helicobacter cetorum (strain ATCC BAA-540 / CCUG 52418 / MIT 99-5656) TaxID=1163745 RepID=I0ER15_HELCM|nr:D-glycero-beta-D-manno-heptose 1,7-bisphosphate 7-phosphatase [Helicobacter cetorum]AFI05384.1 D,D-heptose 1,7-bisphosphate phosphatase [Helicobacter cetorum MIT 99-5656]
MNTTNKALFLDRDGIINIDKGYVYKREDFEFQKGIFELLSHAKHLGYKLLLITNQSGINRGYYTLKDFEKLTEYLQENLLKKLGFSLDGIYFCPHTPQENCYCRKPKPLLILQATKEHNINLEQSFMIGDKESDIMAGLNAKVKNNILLTTNPLKTSHSWIQCKDFKEIVDLIN